MAKPPQAASAPTPSAPPAPPPPPSGVNARRATPPAQALEPLPNDPEKAYKERLNAAITRATGHTVDGEDAAATEVPSTPPKAKDSDNTPGSASASPKSTANSTPPSEAGKTEPEKKPPGEASTSSTDMSAKTGEDGETNTRTPRYELKKIARWAEENPEEAAIVRAKVFGLEKDTNENWIKLQNGKRKLRNEIREEREAARVEAQTIRDEAKAYHDEVQKAIARLNPVTDLWDAVAEKVRVNPAAPDIDFDSADAAFKENTGISVDDYMRFRARRGIGNPDAAKLRAENARLKRELEQKAQGTPKTEAAKGAGEQPAEADQPAGKRARPPEVSPAPDAPERAADGGLLSDWDTELPDDHKLRLVAGWQKLFDKEMSKFYDEDRGEYDADPEAVAALVLRKHIAALAADEEEVPQRRAGKKVAARRPNTPTPRRGEPRDDDNGDGEVSVLARKLRPREPEPIKHEDQDGANTSRGPTRMEDRVPWAIERARQRATGELSDD